MQPAKIINDPVHGFIEVPRGLLLDLIDTEVFQRLRRIRQLALSSLVYPGAVHSRFNHCIGAMHLTREALNVLRSKGVNITIDEYDSTLAAILLHDIGHGPFSHALENVLLQGLHHEHMSRAIMAYLNRSFKGKLSTAIAIFEDKHPKKFLHQLVSSQLDMDRLDYLIRDSYFTGVVEGLVAADRIIKTLAVHDGKLVVENKGIYSVEKFIVARRLMYWQVYLHKAVLASEYMIVNVLKRARELAWQQKPVWKNEALDFLFSQNAIVPLDIDDETIHRYTALDDEDIMYAVKQWRNSGDQVLTMLCEGLLMRRLLKAKLRDKPFEEEEKQKVQEAVMQRLGISEQEAQYLAFTGEVSNQAYLKTTEEPIRILFRNGELKDLAIATDLANIEALSHPVTKHFFCYPEWAVEIE